MNTLFALSEGCMYSQLVDRLDAGEMDDPRGYHDLYQEVRTHIDATHIDGQLKAEIMERPEDFVVLDEETVLALLDQRYADKRLVLITNSGWTYTRAMMTYAFDIRSCRRA